MNTAHQVDHSLNATMLVSVRGVVGSRIRGGGNRRDEYRRLHQDERRHSGTRCCTTTMIGCSALHVCSRAAWQLVVHHNQDWSHTALMHLGLLIRAQLREIICHLHVTSTSICLQFE